MTKYPEMCRGQGPGEEFLNFGTLPKFGTGKARHFKFCALHRLTITSASQPAATGSRSGFRDPLFKFWDPSLYLYIFIYLERIKLDVFNATSPQTDITWQELNDDKLAPR